MVYQFEFTGLAETKAFAAMIAEISEPNDVITLQGNLGVGKSEFARAFIQSLAGFDTEVPSPTFTLIQQYDGPDCALWHFDLYRIENSDDVWELGLEEALDDGICLIEWPERLPTLSFSGHLHIHIKNGTSLNSRHFEVTADDTWQQRFEDFNDA